MSATPQPPAPLVDPKIRFRQYVCDVATAQNRSLATRIEAMIVHQDRNGTYFIGSVVGTLAVIYGSVWKWGPRHFFKNPSIILRPASPAICLGILFYIGLFHLRMMSMKVRAWAMIEDYQRELRKVEAHHVPEGLRHLTTLDTVLHEIKTDRMYLIDVKELRRPVTLEKYD
eukprot:PhF_6_TR16598/c0_g1_i1/m.25288